MEEVCLLFFLCTNNLKIQNKIFLNLTKQCYNMILGFCILV